MPDPDPNDDSFASSRSRRATDSTLGKYFLPLLLGLVGTVATGAFTFAWQVSRDMAVLKAQTVSPIEFAKLQERVENMREKGAEVHVQHDREIEQLRNWMRNHRHGGAVPAPADVPSPDAPSPNP